MDHFTMDLLARDRIADLQRDAKEARLARMKASGADANPQPRRPMAGLRRIVSRLAFAG